MRQYNDYASQEKNQTCLGSSEAQPVFERKFKDSGIEWIGKIPESWEVKRLMSQLNEIKDKNYPLKTNKVLSLTIKDGVIPYEEKGDIGNKSKENHEEYKLAYPNTIVLNSMNILIGAVGISKYYGCVSPVYYVFRNRDKTDLRFVNYIMSSTPFQKYLRKFANGILEIRLRVSAEDILKRHIPVPSYLDQQRIADYLDSVCVKIDSLITLQEQMIEKLKEYKRSVITESVTKGLNPKAPMCDSGIDWIGKIPEHWYVERKLSHICNKGISYGIVKLFDPDDTNGVKVLRCSDVLEGYINEGKIRTVTKELSQEYKRTILRGGEIVINVRGTLGGCAVVPLSMKGYNIAREVALVDTRGINNYFLMYYFLSNAFHSYQNRYLAGCIYLGLNIEMLSSCPVIMPPINEQQSIVSYLNGKCSDIDRLIALKRLKIEKLKDYKKSVIFEAVTGKTNVGIS